MKRVFIWWPIRRKGRKIQKGGSFVVRPSVTIERFIIKLGAPPPALIFWCIYTCMATKEMCNGSLILRRNVRNLQENKKNKTDKKKYCQGKNKSVEMLMNVIYDRRKRFFVVKIIIFQYIIDKNDPFWMYLSIKNKRLFFNLNLIYNDWRI